MILVTGASGLVGTHLIQQLSGAEVPIRALYHTQIPLLFRETKVHNIEWKQVDILDFSQLEQAFEGITQVYHCAAMVSYDPREKEQMMQINVEGTANVVNISLAMGIQKLLYVSSIATLGKETNKAWITEKADWVEGNENSNYAISKYQAEMEVWRGIAEGLPAIIIHPSIILGEGNWEKSSSHLFKIVYDEFSFYTQGSTAWVDVQDVVKAMIVLMHSDIQAENFIVSGGNHTYLEVFTWMANAMQKKPPFRKANHWMTECVWRLSYLKSILTGSKASITKETARAAQQFHYFDNSKLLKALPGFSYTPIEETIIRVGRTIML